MLHVFLLLSSLPIEHPYSSSPGRYKSWMGHERCQIYPAERMSLSTLKSHYIL